MHWNVSRGERSEWGMTENRNPLLGAKARLLWDADALNSSSLKSLLMNTLQELLLHAGRLCQCTWKSIQHVLVECYTADPLYAIGRQFKGILCSIHTHACKTAACVHPNICKHQHYNSSAPCITGIAVMLHS